MKQKAIGVQKPYDPDTSIKNLKQQIPASSLHDYPGKIWKATESNICL